MRDVVVAAIALAILSATPAFAKPEYTRKTTKACAFCHQPPGYNLNDAGKLLLRPWALAEGPHGAEAEGVALGIGVVLPDRPHPLCHLEQRRIELDECPFDGGVCRVTIDAALDR